MQLCVAIAQVMTVAAAAAAARFYRLSIAERAAVVSRACRVVAPCYSACVSQPTHPPLIAKAL